MSIPLSKPWVVVLGSHLPYHASAAWLVPEGEAVARQFAEWVTKEIDPAQAMPLGSPAQEILTWCSGVLPGIIADLKKATDEPD